MDKLKVWFADFWPEWKDEDFLTPILSKHYEVVLDRNKPDVLFHSIFNRMQDTPKYKCKKVLILAENWRPSQFQSDYSISFDPHSETNYCLPLWQICILLNPKLKDRLYNRIQYSEEQFIRWGAFTVSNSSNFIRNSAYHQLNGYKHVESYGKYLTTSPELLNYSRDNYWRDAKDKFFTEKPHKFMLAYENSPYPYYCTEKLMDAFLAGSMPIYWGDPKVSQDWNPEAFINAMKNPDWLNEIKRIDQNREYFDQYYKQPVFTLEQKVKLEKNLESFEPWLINIVKK